MSDSYALTEAVYYILLSLWNPRHGYGIMQEAERLSGGRVRLAPGTLYGALNNLLGKGYIEAIPGIDDSRRKDYALTNAGRHALIAEYERLCQLVANGDEVFGGDKHE